MDKFWGSLILMAILGSVLAFPGCATVQDFYHRVAGDRIEQLRTRAERASELLGQVMSDEELAEIRASLLDMDSIDPAMLGTDDSRLWQAYLRVRQIVRDHYAAQHQAIPSALQRFNVSAERIHRALPTVVRGVGDARRLIAVYKLLAL